MSDKLQTTRSRADLLSALRDVLDVIEEHVSYRDDTSMEKLEKRIPWIREIVNDV